MITALICASLAVVIASSATVGAVRRVALGVSVAANRNPAMLDAYTSSVGRAPAIWSIWSDWGNNGPETATGSKLFPTTMANTLRDRGIVPMIVWEPVNPGALTDCNNWSNAAVNSGMYDEYIRDWAQAAKDFGGRVLLRFMHEMNLPYFIWGVGRCTNTFASIKAVWKRVWNIFRGPEGVGATNVKFLWSVSGNGYVFKLYPGDAFVDYTGLTAFNWARPTEPGSWDAWRSMVYAFKPTMFPLLKVSTKPIIAVEVGSGPPDPSCSTCSKYTWIKSGYPAVRNKWPRVKAIVYMDIDLRPAGQPDWRLASPPNGLQAYKEIAANSLFWGTIP
jgi:hypothetical protein